MKLTKSERENCAIAGGTAIIGSTIGWTSVMGAPSIATVLAASKAGTVIAVAAGPAGIAIGAGLLLVAGCSALWNRKKKS